MYFVTGAGKEAKPVPEQRLRRQDASANRRPYDSRRRAPRFSGAPMIQGIGRVAGLTVLAMVLWTVPEVSGMSVDELIIKYTNQERARVKNRSLKPLVPSKSLTYIALKHSIHQAQTGVMAHEDKKYPPGWRTTSQRFAKIGLTRSSWAENVFMKYPYGSDESYARAAVRWWMNSPPHRANILEPSMKYIGVGVSQSPSKPGLVGYATQAFASAPGAR